MLLGIYVLIFLSGMTGLVYQVTWQKYLSIMLGSHAQAAAMVLALFFLFLSVGYEIFGRISSRLSKDRLIQYAGLEFLIGVFALYSPKYFELLFSIYGNTEGGLLTSICFSALFIFFPTILMGGTIPVLTQGLSASFETSAKTHGLIYALNTLGAFAGVVVGGFYLIEHWGLPGTLTLTGDLNLFIGLAALALARKNNFKFWGPAFNNASRESAAKLNLPLLVVSFLSGFYVFTAEKLVIRLAGLSAGSSVYSYSIVVAAFVLAIGVGSLFLVFFEKRISPRSFVFVLIATFFSLLTTYLSVSHWPIWILRVRFLFQSAEMNFVPFWLAILFLFTLLLLIPVGLMGVNLPMLFGLLRQQGKDLSASVGRLYAVNCLGATAGAILGGYVSFNFLEGHQVFKMALVLIALSGAIALFVLGRRWPVAGGYFFVCCLIALPLPAWRPQNFTPGKYLNNVAPVIGSVTDFFKFTKERHILYERFDPNTYVSVTEEPEGARGLYVNGKPDALTGGDNFTRAMAALTPISLAPNDIRKVFIVGLGAGLSTAVATRFPEVQKVRVAEISSGVIKALPFFKKFNFDLSQRMEKVEIALGDGYKILLSDSDVYDLVICEPSNPWVAGIEKLYSREFYKVIHDKLPEHGIFAQWFPMFSTDKDTVLSIFKTFAASFPHVTVWSAGGGALTLVGTKHAFRPSFDKLSKRYAEQRDVFEKLEVRIPELMLTGQILTDFEFRSLLEAEGSINSVYDPMLEFRAGRSYFSGKTSGLDDIRMQRLPLPIPQTLEKGSLIYRDYKLPPEVFVKAKTPLVSHYLSRLKLILHLWRTDSSSPVLKEEYVALGDYLYLLGETDLGSVSQEELSAKVAKLAVNLRQLNAILEIPKLSQIHKVISRSQKETDQILMKLSVVQILGAPEDIQTLQKGLQSPAKPTGEDQLKITAAYERIVATYKEIGAY